MLGRLAEIYFLQGRFRMAEKCFNEANALPRQFLGAEEGAPSRIRLKGGPARSYLRFAIRLNQYERSPELPDSVPAFFDKRSQEHRETAFAILSANHAHSRNKADFEHDTAVLELDLCLWHRAELRSNGAPSEDELRAVLTHYQAAEARAWHGFVSPLLKMELLREQAACSWLASSEGSDEERMDHALSALGRLIELSRLRGYPLVECDARLQRAEILRTTNRDPKVLQIDLSRATEIISAHDYGLRWTDLQLISDDIAAPSRVLIC